MATKLAIANTLKHWDLIQAAAQAHGLPGFGGLSGAHILAGLVCQESMGITHAYRAEPRYRWLIKAALRPWIIGKDTSTYMQRISFGLCQVMGAVARELKFDGWLSELFLPAVGLEHGAKHLAVCIKRAKGRLYNGLRRYNGHPRLPKTERYADAVLDWAREIKEHTGRGAGPR